ncbi:lipopolysaccharide biosynthesis protein [Microbacterium sp.]|uniref:lipopolysaccharide biosynthesis protein n=1 Tax=Microbacterium sp. TaxID=51671 RepID=UPI0039E499EF
MSDGARGARGARLTLGGQAIKFTVQLLSTVLLARLLGPGDFGTFAMAAAVTGFAALLSDFGLSTAAIQATSLSRAQRANLFWISAGIGLTLFAVFFAGAPLIESFYATSGITEVIRVMAVSFLLASMTSQFTAQLTRSLQFGRLAIVDITAQVCGLVAALLLALDGAGYWALVGQQLAVTAVVLLMSIVFARWVPGLPSRAPMKGLLQFAANSFGVQALSYASGNADSVALGKVGGADALGLYDRAYQLFKIPIQQIAAPLTRVALPILSRQQGDRTKMSRYVVSAQRAVAYVLGAAFCLGAALASPIIEIALGPNWTSAAPIFAVLALGGVFQVMGYVYYWSFLACGLTGLQLRYSIVTRALMILLIVVGAFGGAMGMAAAVSVGLAVNWAVLSAFPMRKTGLDVQAIVRTGLRATGVNAAVAGAVWVTDVFVLGALNPFLRIGIGLTLAALLYAALVWLVPPLRKDAIAIVRAARRRS